MKMTGMMALKVGESAFSVGSTKWMLTVAGRI